MNNFFVVEAQDTKWSEIINGCKYFDFYHTQSYHLLEKQNRPVLLVGIHDGITIALPLIIRQIPNSELFDCTSAYGYCGPISNINLEEVPKSIINLFTAELLQFFKENDIVTAFSRLHPIISFGEVFDDFGQIIPINKTVAIDLKISPEEQRKQYRKSNKSELNQLQRKGYEVVEAETDDEINSFIDIYNETMRRVEASNSYFFSQDYFYNFLKNKCFQNKLLLAKKDGVVTAGAIFTVTNTIMQYHLAGTTEAYIKETPMKLILDKARLMGNELGLEFLHLGGGVGGSDEDSLFRFKSGFSDYRCLYQVWRIIVDEKKYQELVEKSKANKNSSFFPLYRSI